MLKEGQSTSQKCKALPGLWEEAPVHLLTVSSRESSQHPLPGAYGLWGPLLGALEDKVG